MHIFSSFDSARELQNASQGWKKKTSCMKLISVNIMMKTELGVPQNTEVFVTLEV
jgi:hypothetical protein